MNDPNPYLSPNETSDPAPQMQPSTGKLSIVAIIVGFLVDIGVTFALLIALGIVTVVIMLSSAASPGDLEANASNSPIFNLLSLAIGCFGTLCGAYVAGWVAKHSEMRHAIGVGIVSLCFGIALLPLTYGSQPIWLTAAAILLALPSAWLGGYLRQPKTTDQAVRPADDLP